MFKVLSSFIYFSMLFKSLTFLVSKQQHKGLRWLDTKLLFNLKMTLWNRGFVYIFLGATQPATDWLDARRDNRIVQKGSWVQSYE